MLASSMQSKEGSKLVVTETDRELAMPLTPIIQEPHYRLVHLPSIEDSKIKTDRDTKDNNHT
jgi:hypothetical protein